jgi:superoxide dismutase, Fe-Mn family
MPDIDRRRALGGIALGAAAISAGEAIAQTPAPVVRPPAFAGSHQVKPLAFDPTKLDGLSEKLIRSHWENWTCNGFVPVTGGLNTRSRRPRR